MKKKWALTLAAALASLALLTGCAGGESLPVGQETGAAQGAPDNHDEEGIEAMKMIVSVNGRDFTATLEQNDAAYALAQMMEDGPVTLHLSDYAGFEKVGPLGARLPAADRQTTTQPGDIVLYQGDQIVMFYGSNAWSYTRLGRIDDLTGWVDALGDGDVSVTLALAGASPAGAQD